MSRPLESLLVLALEQAVAAPLCTSRLADAGARVIKIERSGGETARHYDRTVHGTSAYFAWLNRGKESIVLDLKSELDRELLESMLRQADVFVQNLAPGAAARLGLDSRALATRFSQLIAVDICGYGSDTPASTMRAYDMLVQAESGICAVTGTPDAMAKVGVSVADIATGMNAHSLIAEALVARARTGRGQAIEIAMFDAMADWMAVPLLHLLQAGRVTQRCGISHASIYPYAPFNCRDGQLMIAIQSPAEWRRFCAGVLARPELEQDERFKDNPARLRNRAALEAIIGAAFGKWHRSEAIDILEANEIAWGRVSQLADVAAHPALHLTSVALPGGGLAEVPRPVGRTDHLPAAVPDLDQHGVALRREFGA